MNASEKRKYPHAWDAEKYCKAVLSGKVVACHWVIQACKRQDADLKRRKNKRTFPFVFDYGKANRICNFIELLPHVKGKWAKQYEKIKLEPWQKFILTTVFGWVYDDGHIDKDGELVGGCRRFRTVYIEVPRKNAKSTITAGVALYMLGPDEEVGAEIYSAATTRDQAKIVFGIAKQMAQKSKGLLKKYGIAVNAHNLNILKAASRFEPLSAEGNSLDGLNVHFASVDELHAHKTRTVYDVLETATGSRSQALVWNITTAGFDLAGICYEQRTYVTKILDGVLKDETYFGIVYTIDDGDDWTSPDIWKKANPNLGVSVSQSDIERLCKKAVQLPAAQNNFLTKRLNHWVNADSTWMNMVDWKECGDTSLKLEDFKGMPCYVGLDLASKIDVAVLMMLIVVPDGFRVFGKYYLPEKRVEAAAGKATDHYSGWAKEGRFTLTPGNMIDYSYIKDDLIQVAKDFEVIEVGYDPFQATQFVTEMDAEGLTMVEVGATVKNFSEPMKRLEGLVLDRELKHDGCPILTWMISNTVCHYDKKDNIFPNKEKPENKIDGVVGLITALNRVQYFEEGAGVSVYEERGFVEL